MVKERTEERTQFLTDVLVTAVEGGIGYWSFGEDYKYAGPAESRGFTILELAEDEGDVDLPVRIDLDTIDQGLRRIMAGDVAINVEYRVIVGAASFAGTICPEGCADVDSLVADCIVQVGLFGEVRYG